MIALAPTAIWLVASGQLAEITGFGFGFKLRQAWTSPVSLERDGEKLRAVPVERLAEQAKDRVLREEAVSIRPGAESKDGVIECLLQRCVINHLILTDQEGQFRALVSAKELTGAVASKDTGDLEKQKEYLKTLLSRNEVPSIVDVVTRFAATDQSRESALRKMLTEPKTTDGKTVLLPVVDDQKKFVGLLDKQKVLENMVLDLVSK